jgi:signal transduction histidine kinase
VREGASERGPLPFTRRLAVTPQRVVALLSSYVFAGTAIGLALLATIWMGPLREGSPFLLLTGAVMVSALYGGPGPALFASIVALVGTISFLTPRPPGEIWPHSEEFLIPVLFFGLLAAISLAVGYRRRSHDKLHGLQKQLERQDLTLETAIAEFKQRLENQKRAENERAGVVQKARGAAEEAFRQKAESLAMVEELLAIAGVGLAILDRDFRYTRVNDFYTALTGVPAKTQIGNSIRTATPRLWPLLEPVLERVQKTGEPILYHEISCETAAVPGGQRHWLMSCYPLKNATEPGPGLGVIMIDMTDRKHAQDLVIQHAEELSKSHAKLERLAYMAFYDLKEPLLIVTSHAKLLAKRYQGQLDGSADELITETIDGISQMERLIGELVSYLQTDAQTKTFGPVETSSVLEWALHNLETEIAETGAVVTHDSLPTVKGNATELIHLFQNLLGYAVKSDGTVPRIHISATLQKTTRDTPDWVFSLRDNAMAIEPHAVDRMFLLYEGVLCGTDRTETGFGLAICKKIIEGGGGQFWVESTSGMGSIFFFSLAPPSSH